MLKTVHSSRFKLKNYAIFNLLKSKIRFKFQLVFLEKNSDAAVIVHHFQSMSGGGILDPDDRLSDVVDDREQIVVNFEDVTNGVIHHGGGDGASGSSVGTCSPDIFRVTKKVFPIEDEPQTESTCNNIEVTADDIHSASSSSQLQVGFFFHIFKDLQIF